MSRAGSESEGRLPFVSIGVAVYNGEAYLEEALSSIAAQTFRDFEVILSDNASTDRTRAICEAYTARDSRFRYFRNAVNIGGDRNYYRTFELARGKYFLGVAHDDRIDPEYLSKVLPVLESDPSVVFCHSRAHQIDATGAIVGTYDAKPFTESSRPSERFRDAISLRPVIACLGVIRSSVLRRMAPLLVYPASDAHWQAELALHGKLVEIPDVLFHRRVHPGSGQRIPLHERIKWSDPAKAGDIIFPAWRRPTEYARSVFRCPVPLSEKAACFVEIGRYIRRRGGTGPLSRDVKMAMRTLMTRSRAGAWLLARWSRSHRH